MNKRALLAPLWLVWLLPACSPPKAAPKPQATAITRLFLGDWIDTPDGRCQVSSAEARVTESPRLPFAEARIRPDVRTVDVTMQCETKQGSIIKSGDALSADTLILLQTNDGKRRAPRPAVPEDTRDHLQFELPDELPPQLPTQRRYDAQSGLSVVAREAVLASLVLHRRADELHVQLRHRYQDAAFDALLDELAGKLARGEALRSLADESARGDDLESLSRIYRDVTARFQPSRLELSSVQQTTDGLHVALSLLRPQRHAVGLEVARFQLSLRKQADGSLRIQAFLNQEQARSALTCGALLPALQQDVALLYEREPAQLCNVLGTLLPGNCPDVDAQLVNRTLSVALRCSDFSEDEQKHKGPLPSDFQLTMRRGRSKGGPLDKSPRYVVVLFENGHVVFHGKHWVNAQERSDGRTHRALLSGLYQHVQQLSYFDRRGGQFDYEHCIPSDDEGDVITVKARERERMVLNREGCRGPFTEVELNDLRRHVERVAGVSGWTQPRPTYVDRGVQHWAVAE